MYSMQVLLLAIAFLATNGFQFHLPHHSCEKISIPLCHRVLPYNLTRFPNLLGDRSQVLANRSIQRYGPLVKHSNCSKHAVFLLCSFYLPICIPGIDDTEENVFKPCRSLCEQVRTDCAALMDYWPSFVKCEELPEYSDAVCIQPESFISVSKPSRGVDYDGCQGRPQADYNLYINRQYDYVIKFKVVLIERVENKGTIVRGRVGRVFKQNNVTIHKGQRLTIRSNTNSTCPSLGTGKVFLIGGYENASRAELLLSSTSLIEAWNEKILRKIRRWQRMEKKGRKKEGRRSP